MVKSLGEVRDGGVPNTMEGPNIYKDDSDVAIGAGFDLNDIIKPESKSRCGKIFSPEKLMAKSKVDALKPWVDENARKKLNEKKFDNLKLNEVKIDLSTVNISMSGNSGVQRLLRHLKKARLEKMQHSNIVEASPYISARHGQPNEVATSQQNPLNQPDLLGKTNKTGKIVESEKSPQIQLSQQTSKRNTGIYGPTIGDKYQNRGMGKKLSLGHQVSRKDRDLIMTPKDIKKQPPVGHYHPQYGQVVNRPKSQGFSQMQRRLQMLASVSGSAIVRPPKCQEDTISVPRDFEDQLQRIRMEKMERQKSMFNTQNIKADGHQQSINNEDSADKPSNIQKKPNLKTKLGSENQYGNSKKLSGFHTGQNSEHQHSHEDQSYKTQRFCNTVRVYKQFCKITGIKPEWQDQKQGGEVSSIIGPDNDPLRKRSQLCINFDKYSKRKAIIDGEYSACDERFNQPQRSQLSLQNWRVNIQKYASRDSKSSGGDNFAAPISGLFYDKDNYALSQASTSHSFQGQQVWQSLQDKQKYAKYRLSKAQIGKINFSAMNLNLKSVKPKTGKALKKMINKEDNQFFFDLVVAPHHQQKKRFAFDSQLKI